MVEYLTQLGRLQSCSCLLHRHRRHRDRVAKSLRCYYWFHQWFMKYPFLRLPYDPSWRSCRRPALKSNFCSLSHPTNSNQLFSLRAWILHGTILYHCHQGKRGSSVRQPCFLAQELEVGYLNVLLYKMKGLRYPAEQNSFTFDRKCCFQNSSVPVVVVEVHETFHVWKPLRRWTIYQTDYCLCLKGS